MQINNTLRSDKIEKTLEILSKRILERFPDSSLGQTCVDFHKYALKSTANIESLGQPYKVIRVLSFSVMAIAVLLIIYGLSFFDYSLPQNFAEVTTISEAFFNNIVLLGAAFFFLFSFEKRLKRRRAIQFLNEIKGFIHVVDMHQLIKDPQMYGSQSLDTENSPKRSLTKFELERYLSYCSEFSSLIGKVAALYGQSLSDEAVAQSSSELEALCSSIANKIWQKQIILNATDA